MLENVSNEGANRQAHIVRQGHDVSSHLLQRSRHLGRSQHHGQAAGQAIGNAQRDGEDKRCRLTGDHGTLARRTAEQKERHQDDPEARQQNQLATRPRIGTGGQDLAHHVRRIEAEHQQHRHPGAKSAGLHLHLDAGIQGEGHAVGEGDAHHVRIDDLGHPPSGHESLADVAQLARPAAAWSDHVLHLEEG